MVSPRTVVTLIISPFLFTSGYCMGIIFKLPTPICAVIGIVLAVIGVTVQYTVKEK